MSKSENSGKQCDSAPAAREATCDKAAAATTDLPAAQMSFNMRMDALQSFASFLKRNPIDLTRASATDGIPDELAALLMVFDLLARRRAQFRRLMGAAASRYTSNELSNFGVERADDLLTLYYTLVLAPADEAGLWTLRDRPDLVHQNMADLLCDLHHLADATQIDWELIKSDAERSYHEEAEDLSMKS